MTYEVNGNNILIPINRTEILDISPDDMITLRAFPGVQHAWTTHDADFLENNPDDDIYLEVERLADDTYRARGILLKSSVVR